jgi:hypothetical protein
MINPGARELAPNRDTWLASLAHEFGIVMTISALVFLTSADFK